MITARTALATTERSTRRTPNLTRNIDELIRSLRRIQCCVEVGPKTLAENKASLHRPGLRRVVEKQEGTSNADVHEEQNVDVETKHILHQRLGGKRNGAGILHFKFFGIFGAYEHWMLTSLASAGCRLICVFLTDSSSEDADVIMQTEKFSSGFS